MANAARYPRANPARWWNTRTVGSAHRSPAAMFISPLRRYSTLTCLVVLVSLIAGVWYITNPKRISLMAEVLLSSVLGAEAHVGTGHLSVSGTLLLSDVQLKTAGPNGEKLDLFSADQVEMRFDWLSLLTGELRATQFTAVRPTLYLIEDRTANRWNYERLEKGAGNEGSSSTGQNVHAVGISSLPFIVLRDARVQWAEINNGVQTLTGGSIIDGQLTPDPRKPMVYDFQMDEHPDSGADRATVSGSWDVANNTFSASTQAIDLSMLDPASLPRQVRQWWSEHELSGKVASLRTTLDHESGLNVFIDLQNVSMVQVVDERTTQSPIAKRVPFKNVSGSLQFNVTHSKLQVTGLTGSVLGYNFVLNAEFGGFSPDSPFNVSLQLPHANIPKDYPDLIYSFPVAYDVVQRIRPAGLMDISLDIKRPLRNGHVFTTGTINCRDVSARFSYVPYPLQHARGLIRILDDHMEMDNVTANADESRIVVFGMAGLTPENQAIDMSMRADYAIFDERLKACLPQNVQDMWSLFAPVGTGKILCRVSRPNRPHEEPRIDLTIEADDVSGSYRDFPYPLQHMHGKIVFGDTQTQIVGLDGSTGLDGTGAIHFDGTVEYPHGEAHDVTPRVRIVADHVPMDASLVAALPLEYKPWTEKIAMTGRLDLDGRITFGSDHEPGIAGTVTLSDATIKVRNPEYAFEHVAASVDMSADVISVTRLVASPMGYPDASITLGASIRQSPKEINISADGAFTALPVPTSPPPQIPEALSKMWARYKPSGAIDGDFSFAFVVPQSQQKSPAGDSPRANGDILKDYTVHLRPRNMILSAAGWPDSISGITGQVAITPEKIEFADLAAQAGDINIQAAGSYLPPLDQLRMSLDARAANLPSKWFVMLPESFKNTLESIKPDGAWVLRLGKLWRDGKAEKPRWDFGGQIDLSDCKMEGKVPGVMSKIRISGLGSFDPAISGLDFTGDLRSSGLTFSNRTIDTLHAGIVATSAEKSIAFNDITGDAAGGKLDGNILIHLEPDARYEASLLLNDADVALLALGSNASAEERRQYGTGRLTATFNVQQQFGPLGDRTGRGDLVVRDANLFHVPLAMGLMQLVTLRLPVSGAFHNVTMSYYLRDNKITFEKILLESPGINLAGLGTLSLQSRQLDLNFVTHSPNEISFPIIFDIAQFIRDQILQIQVSGTLEKPHIQPVQLNAITTPIRNLLPKAKPPQ